MNYLYDLMGYDGDQETPRNNVSDQNIGADIHSSVGMDDHGTMTRGNHERRGANRGYTEGYTGSNRGRGGQRGDKNLFGNWGSRRDDGGNRGDNHGNWRDRRDDSENRGSNHDNRGGDHGNWRDRREHGENSGGYRRNVRRGWPRDRFNIRSRDVSEDRESAHSFQGNQQEPRTRNKYRGQNVRRGRDRVTRSPFRSDMGIKKLEEMSNLEPENLVISLTNEKAELEKLFDNELSNDYMVLILRIIARLCESAFHQNKAQVLGTVCEPKFVDKLNLYLSDITLHDLTDKRNNIFFWEDQERFWNNLLTIYENILKIIPNRACDVLPKLVKRTDITIDDMEREQNSTVSKEMKKRLKELESEIMLSVEEREKKSKIMSQNEEPPDDFRQISLYPSVYEITHNHQQVFLRQNIVEGKYNSVDHYLDVQFRLLREDFVAPLREGVCEYLRQLKTKEHNRIYNVHIFKDVIFLKKQTIQDKIVSIVQLPAMKNKVKLENSKRFMFGSLVCFTKDNFKTIIFGTVASRDKYLIDVGQIAVDILENNTVDNSVPYIMIECSVFFEPYYNVLKALQIMTENTFPFKRYIIDVSSDVLAPSYYTALSKIRHKFHRFSPLVSHTWPSHTKLGLDPSQFRAFQAALTKEFCVIQGPPGTGKTFIGLKVTQVLLENRLHWNKNRSPILVICFTNHALDQFLEGILSYTSKLVRIGGQSKSEELKEFNIRELRKNRDETHSESARLYSYRRLELEYYMTEIRRNTTLLEVIYSGDRIIKFKKFYALDNKIRLSWFERVESHELLDWLLGGRNTEERYEERGRYRLAQQLQAQMQQNQNEDDNDSDELFLDAETENTREVYDRDDFFINLNYFEYMSFTLKTFDDYEELIIDLEIEIAALEMKMEKTNEINFFIERYIKEKELIKTRNDLDYFKYRMYQFRTNNVPPRPQHVDYENPHILTANERWGLYFHWLHLYCKRLTDDLSLLEEGYRAVYRQYEEVRQIEDTEIMRGKHVIGMTTSGAAKYQTLLQALKCPIVIVEEAAEVLESHVVVSLTNNCKHLILIEEIGPMFILAKKVKVADTWWYKKKLKVEENIGKTETGDHQQLRPTTAEYKIAKKYNLEISLFERMVKNNIHCVQLEVQHRMRPEIAQLIVPSIYPKLDNHPSVEMYPPVRGVTKNLFFITHKEPEENLFDTSSKRNIHEAKFLIKLARHLILQGYKPNEITILATYSGQMFCLWKERQQHSLLKDVRITVVDNFQGEESKIILLSLVRSNEEDNVGFLKIDNRICVALSRAKEGMYITGNMDILAKSSGVWREIKTVLENNNQLDTHLTLQCQIHPDRLTRVAKEEDFDQVIEGGCSQPCDEELMCGHICTSLCHATDKQWRSSEEDMDIDDLLEELERSRSTSLLSDDIFWTRYGTSESSDRHLFYKCKEKCKRSLCALNHPCPDQCYKKCKPCMVPKVETLKCSHTHSLPCHLDPADFLCPTEVEVVLDCKHRANKPCHEDIKKFVCPHPCDNKIENCGHACTRRCHIHDDPDHLKMICTSQCERPKANCSVGVHMCLLRCHEECQPCEVIINKKRSCGHMHEVECKLNVEDVECNKRCNKKLDCGHNCKQSCFEPCGNCSEKVTKVIPECKHTIKMKCSDNPVRSKCGGKCPLTLSCGHPCNKTCRERCQTKCEYLVDNPHPAACGHQFQIPCHKAKTNLEPSSYNLLQHCSAPCNALLLCKHRCTGTCGTCAQGRVHATCRQQCGRLLVCGHECTMPCKEICQPCKKRCSYRCAHNKCGQKCGEPCKPCMEPCTRRCAHVRCSKKCSQICDVPPCTVPCPKILKCGHPCIGYCGDPCPPVCRVCNPDDEMFSEEKPDARFVYLAECKHVIEAETMDTWLTQHVQGDMKEINAKNCPKCKTTLAVTQRYSTFVKEASADINKVKEKWFGQQQQNEDRRIELLMRIAQLKNINKNLFTKSALLQPRLHGLQNILREKYKGKRNPLNIIAVISVTSQLGLIETLVNAFTNGDLDNHENLYEACLKRLNYILDLMHNKDGHISKQRISEIEMEINRFERFVLLCTIEKNQNFKPAVALPNIKTLYKEILDTLNSIERYSEATDKSLQTSLENLADAIDKSITITEHEKQTNVEAIEEQNHTLLSEATDGSLKASLENLAEAVDKSINTTEQKKQTNVATIEERNHTVLSEATDGFLTTSLENLAEAVDKSITITEHEKQTNVKAIEKQNHTLVSEATDESLKLSLENLVEAVDKSINTTEQKKQTNVAAIEEQNHTLLSEATVGSLKLSLENLAETGDKSITITEQEKRSIVAAIEEQNHTLLSEETDGFLKTSLENLAGGVDKSTTITEHEKQTNVEATEEQNHTLLSEATDGSLKPSLENLAETVDKSITITEHEKQTNAAPIEEQNHTLLSEATDGILKTSLENLAEAVDKSITITEHEKQTNVTAIEEQNHTLLSEATDEFLKTSLENLAGAVDKSITITEHEKQTNVEATEEQNHTLLSEATNGFLKTSLENLAHAVEKSITLTEHEKQTNVEAIEKQNHTLLSEATDGSLKPSLENLAEAVGESITITEQEKRSIVAPMQENNEGLGLGHLSKCPNGHYFTM